MTQLVGIYRGKNWKGEKERVQEDNKESLVRLKPELCH
jgi:hypothetical protein